VVELEQVLDAAFGAAESAAEWETPVAGEA
jgi:hypothetical protein